MWTGIRMTDLDHLLTEIDELSVEELETVYRHIVQRRQLSYWLIPGERLKEIQAIMQPVYEQSAHLTDEAINAAIDEALDEVRSEHKSQTHRSD
jgi:hypothetical protein